MKTFQYVHGGEPERQQALAFQVALNAVDLDAVPVMTSDRSLPRKEQARLLRSLLKQLKVPHVSVTTPNYSMAMDVDVRLPYRQDYPLGYPQAKWPETEAGRANRAARKKFERLLLRAFPKHDNHSDMMYDHVDSCWSVSAK